MRYQDQLVRMTQKALDDISRAARAIPLEKADWSPGGVSRSTLAQMQEVATSGVFFLPLIRDRVVPDFGEHAKRESARIKASYDTIDKCVDAARLSSNLLCQAIADFPDRALEEEIQLPFGGGMIVTMADVLAMHHWNLVYHLGQINQIQLVLGDHVMH